MSRHVFFVDITRHDVGPVQSLISSAQDYITPFQPEVREWFALQHQSKSLDGQDVHTVSAKGPQLWPEIESRILAFPVNGEPQPVFHVLSYSREILNLATTLTTPARTVQGYSLQLISPLAQSEPAPAKKKKPASVSKDSDVAPPAGSIELTKRVLAEKGFARPDKAVRAAILRSVLEKYDECWKKNPNDTRPKNKWIETIIKTGRDQGWLHVVGGKGEELIYLASPNDVERAEAARTASDGRARTLQMIRLMKAKDIYAPAHIRELVFHALSRMRKDSGTFPLQAAQILRHARGIAEKEAQASETKYDYWPVAVDGILNVMLVAGVFIGDNDQPIKAGIRARGASVKCIDADFENRCERYLAKFVIRELKDFRNTHADRTALAHALFKMAPTVVSREQMVDRIDELIYQLGEELIEDHPSGRLRVAGAL